jgi:hypothetical protein
MLKCEKNLIYHHLQFKRHGRTQAAILSAVANNLTANKQTKTGM